jgi:hypothetical protein
MNCAICGGVIDAAAETWLENWLRHHFRQTLSGDGAHIIANLAVPVAVWALPKLRRLR